MEEPEDPESLRKYLCMGTAQSTGTLKFIPLWMYAFNVCMHGHTYVCPNATSVISF